MELKFHFQKSILNESLKPFFSLHFLLPKSYMMAKMKMCIFASN